jgi:RNA polymerase sigma factor (sigma-70 family)
LDNNDRAEIPNLDEYIKDIKTLAAKLFRKYAVKGMDLEDIVSEGILGLYDAYKRFDPNRGVSFKTYSHYRVKGSMIDSMRRWLPCSHQMNKKDRIELIEKFERSSKLSTQDQEDSLTDNFEVVDIEDVVDKLLLSLTEQQRDVIELLVQKSQRIGDAAEILGLSKLAIVNIRDVALEKLKNEAKRLGVDESIFNYWNG